MKALLCVCGLLCAVQGLVPCTRTCVSGRRMVTPCLHAKRRTTLSRRRDPGVAGEEEDGDDQQQQPEEAPPQQQAPTSDLLVFKKSGMLSSSPLSAEPARAMSVSQQLESDISRFQERERAVQAAREQALQSSSAAGGAKAEENSVVASLKSAFSTLLIADFFLVIFFLVWFLAAAALQSTNAFLLERFQDIFQPVVVPSLTVLMVGSIASGVTGQEDKDN